MCKLPLHSLLLGLPTASVGFQAEGFRVERRVFGNERSCSEAKRDCASFSVQEVDAWFVHEHEEQSVAEALRRILKDRTSLPLVPAAIRHARPNSKLEWANIDISSTS